MTVLLVENNIFFNWREKKCLAKTFPTQIINLHIFMFQKTFKNYKVLEDGLTSLWLDLVDS